MFEFWSDVGGWQRTVVKKTKKGKVLKVVNEHYLRDDIWCGSQLCTVCKPTDSKELKLTSDAKQV